MDGWPLAHRLVYRLIPPEALAAMDDDGLWDVLHDTTNQALLWTALGLFALYCLKYAIIWLA